jgi:hypothetical protein
VWTLSLARLTDEVRVVILLYDKDQVLLTIHDIKVSASSLDLMKLSAIFFETQNIRALVV